MKDFKELRKEFGFWAGLVFFVYLALLFYSLRGLSALAESKGLTLRLTETLEE